MTISSFIFHKFISFESLNSILGIYINEIILVQCIWSACIVLKNYYRENIVSLDLELNSRAPRNTLPYTHTNTYSEC